MFFSIVQTLVERQMRKHLYDISRWALRLGAMSALALLPCLLGLAADAPIAGAIEAFHRGDLDAASNILQLYIQSHPDSADALGLLGVVLDNQKRYQDAGAAYGRALKIAPNSASLLNNYGNHLLAVGNEAGARTAFLKVIALKPDHPNANLQLARLEVKQKKGAEALVRLRRLSAEDQKAPDVLLLRMEALFLVGKKEEAGSILDSLSAGRKDAAFSFSAGLALVEAGQYEKAEALFARALEAAPADFDVLYNLGLAGLHAGHFERAHNVLTAALAERPQDVDVLYNLAVADAGLERSDAALRSLAQAARLAPDRANIQLLLAHTASEVGAHMDALEAWNRYLKLVPGDDVARRERGFLEAGLGRHAAGIAELKWYIAKHPDDPLGHYQLGVVEGLTRLTAPSRTWRERWYCNPIWWRRASIAERSIIKLANHKLRSRIWNLRAGRSRKDHFSRSSRRGLHGLRPQR